MIPVTRRTLVFLLVALPVAGHAAGKYSWFDDVSGESSAIQASPSAFGTDVYRSTPDPSLDPAGARDTKVSIYGDYASRSGLTSDDADSRARRFANFGVRWQHRVSAQDQLAVSAQQGESMLPRPSTAVSPEALDTRATISWRRELSWSWKPSITGGVFLGDESVRDETIRQFGRRYYGFAVGGELRLLEAHTPYVSFRMERSLYDLPDTTAGNGVNNLNGSGSNFVRTTDDSSRLAAGWRWQVQRGWSMQAEASYGFNLDSNADLLLQDRERSRVFFGTRFDFR